MPEKTNIAQIEVKELYNLTPPFMIDYVGAGGIITSNVIYVGGYTHITGYVYSVVSSATDGVIIEQAQSANVFAAAGVATTTAITNSSMTYTALDTTSNALSVQIVAPFARIVYINGAVAQDADPGVVGAEAFCIYFCARIIRGL